MVGGVGNGAAEEDWCWDLNPGAAAAATEREDHAVLEEKRRERGPCFGRVGTPWRQHS